MGAGDEEERHVPERPHGAEHQACPQRGHAELETVEREAAPAHLLGKRAEPEHEERDGQHGRERARIGGEGRWATPQREVHRERERNEGRVEEQGRRPPRPTKRARVEHAGPEVAADRRGLPELGQDHGGDEGPRAPEQARQRPRGIRLGPAASRCQRPEQERPAEHKQEVAESAGAHLGVRRSIARSRATKNPCSRAMERVSESPPVSPPRRATRRCAGHESRAPRSSRSSRRIDRWQRDSSSQ